MDGKRGALYYRHRHWAHKNVAHHSQAAKQSARSSQSIAVMEQILHNGNVEQQQYTTTRATKAATNKNICAALHDIRHNMGRFMYMYNRYNTCCYYNQTATTLCGEILIGTCVFAHKPTQWKQRVPTCGGFMLNGKRVNNCFDLPHGTLLVVMYKFNLRWWFIHRLMFCHAELLCTRCKLNWAYSKWLFCMHYKWNNINYS